MSMQDSARFGPSQSQGQQGQGQSWHSDRPGRSVIQTTFEIANPRDAEQVAAAAVSVPGIGFKTYEDDNTGRTKVSITVSKQAAQRLNQVNALHQQLMELSLRS